MTYEEAWKRMHDLKKQLTEMATSRETMNFNLELFFELRGHYIVACDIIEDHQRRTQETEAQRREARRAIAQQVEAELRPRLQKMTRQQIADEFGFQPKFWSKDAIISHLIDSQISAACYKAGWGF